MADVIIVRKSLTLGYSLLFRLRIMGTEEENSCAVISQKEVFSDFCSSDNRWICQKKLNHDCNPCPDS